MRVRNAGGKFITVKDFAYYDPRLALWVMCDKESAKHAQNNGFSVCTGAKGYRRNIEIAKGKSIRNLRAKLIHFPGRTKGKDRPDGKPEQGFKAPNERQIK